MFKINIDKDAIEQLVALLKKNNLTQIEVKDGRKSIKIAKESISVEKITDVSQSINQKKDNKQDTDK